MVSANSQAAGQVCSAVTIHVIPIHAATCMTIHLERFRMLVASKVIMGSCATSNTPKTLIRIIQISTSKSRRDVPPSAVDVNLHPPSCFVSRMKTKSPDTTILIHRVINLLTLTSTHCCVLNYYRRPNSHRLQKWQVHQLHQHTSGLWYRNRGSE